MHVVYSSAHYHVVEFPGQGFELINKMTSVGTYLHGDAGSKFRDYLAEVIADDASVESVDDFLGNFDVLMHQPTVYH